MFPLVINTFETMLRLWGGDVWVGQPTELPQIALDSIKDNNSFTSIEAYKTGSSSSLLGWIEPFLQSILPLNTFPEVLRRIFQIFTEELQHERFASCRPIYLAYFFSARIWYSLRLMSVLTVSTGLNLDSFSRCKEGTRSKKSDSGSCDHSHGFHNCRRIL